MDGQTLGAAGLSMQGIGGILALIGAYSDARARRAGARLDDINAEASGLAAQAAVRAGQHEQQQVMLATAGLKSQQRVSLGASGVDLGEGSAARVLTDTDVMGEIDRNQVAANALREAWGYRTQAVGFRNDADQRRAISPTLAAATSMLTSASGVAREWYALGQRGGGLTPSQGTSDVRAGVRGARGY